MLPNTKALFFNRVSVFRSSKHGVYNKKRYTNIKTGLFEKAYPDLAT
jgi:hypothetical protein